MTRLCGFLAPCCSKYSLHSLGFTSFSVLRLSNHASPVKNALVQPGQPVYGGGSSQGGRSSRGGGRGTFGRHGRGRGGGRGKPVNPRTSASTATNAGEAAQSSVQGPAAPSKPQPQMAWCELCRVDCTTQEILEKHKNGKKHQRNLKVFEEMQNLSKHVTATHPQHEGAEAPQQAPDMSDKTVPSVAQPSEEAVRGDSSVGRGGLKRKMKAGRGGKWVRAPDGSKRPVEPPKPKQIVHLLCELCNVKCESQVVYDSHLAGKKHLSNLKRYQGHKEAFGDGIQALYPTIPNLPPTTVALPQATQDAQALASMLLSNQNLPDPQAAQAALAQLLTEHGIHDAQTLMVQLIPYLLTQVQVPLPVAGLGTNAVDLQNQPLQFSTGDAGQNGNITTEQQNLASCIGSEAGVGANDKTDDGTSEAGKIGDK
ncbi:hypothetical protein RND81_01G188100 [Saponaria officinalis]|uniref:U1-type domain-containing protein n=1 Tax=Saponaria officinalis TaxID=3572 RepID=A0AAW1N8L1_SAPOF